MYEHHFSLFFTVNINIIFHSAPFEIRFSVPVERVESATSNPRVGSLKAGLKIAVSTRSTVTSNQILKRIAIKIICITRNKTKQIQQM